jgi:alpha-L-fucosidase
MKLTSLLPGLAFICTAIHLSAPAAEQKAGNADRLREWRDSRFGMFIHWGPVSLKGTEIGWSRGAQIPIVEYDNLYRKFNPTNFNADTWVSVAKAAGMKYVVFTTKHHDGFCMFDTKQTSFNIMQSPFGRDVVKELAAACREQGLQFGTYHSVCDWHHPDFPLTSPGGSVRRPTSNLERYNVYLRNQVRELIQNYGPLHIMWFDVPQEFDQKRGLALEEWTRSLQPDIIINDRSGARGDYDTPEQRVGKYQDNRPWETCMTICNQWAWKPNDAMKSLQQCIYNLVLCSSGDGNLLFNVGPTPDGVIEQRQIDRLKEMGAWLQKNGESIYKTRGGPWKPTKALGTTRSGSTVYVHLLKFEGDEPVMLPNIPRKLVRSSALTGGEVEVVQNERGLAISVPRQHRAEPDTIIKLEFDRSVMDLPAIDLPRPETGADASNIYQDDADYGPAMAFDDDPHTRWATDGGTHAAWIAREFPKPTKIDQVRIHEAFAGRVQQFQFQVKSGSEWKTLFEGQSLGADFSRDFPAVETRGIRLNIQKASEGPTIIEIKLREVGQPGS